METRRQPALLYEPDDTYVVDFAKNLISHSNGNFKFARCDFPQLCRSKTSLPSA